MENTKLTRYEIEEILQGAGYRVETVGQTEGKQRFFLDDGETNLSFTEAEAFAASINELSEGGYT